MLTTTTFIAFLAIVWHAYQSNVSENRAESSVPLIRASADPIKSKPTDEMGMEIPYQDMLVFDQIEEPFAGKERDTANVKFVGDESAEDALPPMQELTKLDETFQTGEKKEQVAALNKIETHASEETVAEVTEDEAVNNEAVTQSVDTAAVEESVPQAEKVITMKSSEKKEEPVKTETAKTETKKTELKSPPVAGDYIVQLGSVRSETGAQDEWKKLSQKLPGVLTPLTLKVEKADLGAKGVFYRIQGGTVSKEAASSICDKIKTTGKDCLIKKVQ